MSWIIAIIIAIIAVYLSYYNCKRIINPLTIIIAFYYITAVFSRLKIKGMYVPDFNSSGLILCNISILILVAAVVSLSKKKIYVFKKFDSRGGGQKKKFEILNNKRETILKTIRIAVLFIQIVVLINLARLLISGQITIESIRYLIWSEEGHNVIFIKEYIYDIYFYMVKAVVIYDFIVVISKVIVERTSIPILTITNIILYCIIMLSRIEILRIIIILVFALSLSGFKLRKIPESIKKASLAILAILIVIANFRTYNGTSVIRNTSDDFIVDISGSYVTFSFYFTNRLAKAHIVDASIINGLFGGLESLIMWICNVIGVSYNNATAILSDYTTNAVNIGASNHYNAFYTMYFNFFATGGYVGCIIASIVLGIVLGMSYKRYAIYKSTNSLIMLLIISQILLFGAMRWELSALSMWIVVLFGVVRCASSRGSING